MGYDSMEKIDGALIHHGGGNRNLYVTLYQRESIEDVIAKMNHMAEELECDKIVGKVPEWGIEPFLAKGYQEEAKIPGLFEGTTTGYFLSQFLDPQRKHCEKREQKVIDSVKTIAKASVASSNTYKMSGNFQMRELSAQDSEAVTNLYKAAYLDYPYPSRFAKQVEDGFEKGASYWGIFEEDRLVETARMYIYPDLGHAEISDFASHPNHRGQNLSYYLVEKMISIAREEELNSVCVLARATSYGRNITLSKLGFSCGGTLRNNTLIGSSLESVNVWYQQL
ncbi:GNAT family N-acetyltransferase [Zeaxanthinibacter enoshimensis]|uniref:GNAT family N-acetyltransferase n=1 Tax=Zeaxanthinibacter enoshimensis TaxID=392009 RepID=UPI003568D3C0